MSSTGLISIETDCIQSDLIDVDTLLKVQGIDILGSINTNNLNLINEITDLSENVKSFNYLNVNKIMYLDPDTNNTNIRAIDTDPEILFKTFSNNIYTKIGSDGELYVWHPFNIILSGETADVADWWSVHDKLQGLRIDANGLRFDVTNLQTETNLLGGITETLGEGIESALATANAAAGAAGAAAGTASNALALAGQKNNIITWNYPLRYDTSNNAYLNYDPNYFQLDSSNNLTLKSSTANYWLKDASNNLYYTSGKVGIGLTNPQYTLDVSSNINCNEIYRNGVSISSTLSNFLPLSGGILTGNLTCTTISATSVSASTFTGSGASLTSINANNVSTGVLTVSRGGTGNNTFTVNGLIYGNGSSNLRSSANLTWDTSNNNLSATNFIGNGSKLTSLNASNVSSGTLSVSQGGTGSNTLLTGQILIGNGTSALLQTQNLVWDNFNNYLGIGKTNPSFTLDVSGNINGKEIYRNNVPLPTFLSSLYPRRSGLLFTCSTSITLNSVTYYKYDIDLRLYTNTYTFSNGPQRKFKIMTWLQAGFFYLSSNWTLNYDINMANATNVGTIGGHSGLNLIAIGLPENYFLQNISNTGTSQFLLRNTFEYLTYVSQVANTAVACIIEDFL